MTPLVISPRDRRALVAALMVVIGGSLVRLGPHALRAHHERSARSAELERQLRASQALVRDEASLLVLQAAAARRLVTLAPFLVNGETSAEASAALLTQISALARHNHVRVARLNPLPDSSASGFIRVASSVEAAGDVRGLTSWLEALEQGRPSIRVQSLTLQADDPGAARGQVESIRAEVVLTAWMIPVQQP